MFSGIIDHCGTITSLEHKHDSLSAIIRCSYTDIVEGESIAVDGICLTATHPKPQQFCCDISSETLALTTAEQFTVGREINLERSLRMGDRVGGHWVMGHVDQRGKVKELQTKQEFTELTIDGITAETMAYIIKKGSIAINGVSLTVNQVLADGFQVMLIPHTLEITNLKHLTPGTAVNLEFDWMTRIIISQLKELPLIKQLS